MKQLDSLPKIELHLHLDGCMSYTLVEQLRPGISRDQYRREFMAPEQCRDLSDFLDHTDAGLSLLQSKEALRLTVNDLCRQLEEDGVIYAEMRFAPLLHLKEGLTASQVVRTVHDALKGYIENSSLEVRLILCSLRSFSEEQSMETVRLVHEFEDTLVAGFDIAGYEAEFPMEQHRPAYEFARKHDISCTAHAGEAFGPESVRQSIDEFKVRRIGHGVRSVEDPDLLDKLEDEGIHLEVCPTSNIQVNVFEQYRDHPVDDLYRRGISLGINTDNRTLSDITLTEEYQKLHEVFGWGKEEFLNVNINALEAAFIPDKLKKVLKLKLMDAYDQAIELR